MPDDEKELELYDGRTLPASRDLARVLQEGLDHMLAELYEARGGMEVEKPEDAYPALRRLGATSETARDYGRTFTAFARKVEDAAGENLSLMFGEQDGIPNNGVKVPDLDGTLLDVKPDYLNEYAFDVDALISGAITSLMRDETFRELAGAMFYAEFAGEVENAETALAEVMSRTVKAVLTLGKFQPQVTKVRALARELSQAGEDGVASTLTDATTKTVKHKGTKIVREQPKGK